MDYLVPKTKKKTKMVYLVNLYKEKTDLPAIFDWVAQFASFLIFWSKNMA
jgi:hypothetical protein